jgi:hypothetical protein
MSASDPRYATVNDGRVYPALTRAEAHAVALRILYVFGDPSDAAVRPTGRNAMRSDLRNIYETWTNGGEAGRICWASRVPTSGHFKGWGRLIHDVSHMIHRYRHPGERPHGDSHYRIEADVLAWVDAELLKPAVVLVPATPKLSRADERAIKYLRTVGAIARWERKFKRAETALRKLHARKRRYERMTGTIATAEARAS